MKTLYHTSSDKVYADATRWHVTGDGAGYPFPADPVMPAALPPWVSTTAHISGHLTSPQSSKATGIDALMLGGTCAALGAGATLLFQLPWYLPLISGFGGAAISAAALVILNRWELHRVVKGQAEKGKPKRQELHIEVPLMNAGKVSSIEHLYVAGITKEQLVEFAPQAMRSDNFAVNVIGGGGRIFTQPQAQALGAELEHMGYVTDARGSRGRKLTAKGRAFFRGLSEMGR